YGLSEPCYSEGPQVMHARSIFELAYVRRGPCLRGLQVGDEAGPHSTTMEGALRSTGERGRAIRVEDSADRGNRRAARDTVRGGVEDRSGWRLPFRLPLHDRRPHDRPSLRPLS